MTWSAIVGTRSAAGLVAGALLALAYAPTASAFAVLSGFGPPRQALEITQRWDAAQELADGVQVAIEPGFIDAMGLTDPLERGRMQQSIVDSFAVWENDGLRFDVTFDGNVADGRLVGAELDVFAEPGGPNLCGSLGGCAWWRTEFRADRRLTNGQTVAGEAILGVDIYMDSATFSVVFDTFEFDGALLIFQRTLMHEIGHGIGLGHPTDPSMTNYDTDLDPFNEMPVDPLDPAAGFIISPNVDCTSTMTNQVGLCDIAAAADIELHADDIGGRDVLYPVVPEAPLGAMLVVAWLAGLRRRPRDIQL